MVERGSMKLFTISYKYFKLSGIEMEKIKQASRRKFHFIYKTTCLVNGKYYIGMHSTDNLEDGYMGSGTRVCRSIKKYGRENFKIEIIEFLSDRENLKIRERE